jgi:hypothetical protein
MDKAGVVAFPRARSSAPRHPATTFSAITTILTMRDGKCVERWSTADMLGLLIQVGAVPPPGA